MATHKNFDMGEEFARSGFSFNPAGRTVHQEHGNPDKTTGYINLGASKNRADAKAIYRMLSNENFDRQEIIRAYREATMRRMAEYGGTILAV
jgi:hypothetical protein